MKGTHDMLTQPVAPWHDDSRFGTDAGLVAIATAQAALEQSCRASTRPLYDCPATLLADGRIALTLDVRDLVRRAGLPLTA